MNNIGFLYQHQINVFRQAVFHLNLQLPLVCLVNQDGIIKNYKSKIYKKKPQSLEAFFNNNYLTQNNYCFVIF
jgi:hypothetical protein